MNEPITPALTPEEWVSLDTKSVGRPISSTDPYRQLSLDVDDRREERTLLVSDQHECVSVGGVGLHALAALALYGQPFGFGWKDVDELRSYSGDGWHRPVLESIADRIAALLPPRDA